MCNGIGVQVEDFKLVNTLDKEQTILHENNVPSRPSLDVRAVLLLCLKNIKTVLPDSDATVTLADKET